MQSNDFIILFKKDKAYLTAEFPLDFIQLGLPSVAPSHNAAAYWKIQVLKYDDNKKSLYCRIKSYSKGIADFPDSQKEIDDLLQLVEKVDFEDIDVIQALNSLTSGDSAEQMHTAIASSGPKRSLIEQTFLVNLAEITFQNGGVTVERKFTGIAKAIRLFIPNNYIKEEFEAVKEYFGHVLDTKRITVKTNVEVIGEEIVKQQNESAEIARIDGSFIETVRFEIIRRAMKNAKKHGSNAINVQDILETKNEKKISLSSFYDNEKELMDDIIKITEAKHYRQLRYLSVFHDFEKMRLKLVLSPLSFLFLILKNGAYYFVWETLNTTEATYIWKSEKQDMILEDQIDEVLKLIGQIKSQGKLNYLESQHHKWKRVFHDNENSDQAFEKWKVEMEQYFSLFTGASVPQSESL